MAEPITTPTLIIGAGPAGLAVAGRLARKRQEYLLLEASDKIAFSWHNHYHRLCLHTVKQYSHLPHLPFPENYPTYVPREDLVRYYKQYAAHFGIEPRFGKKVVSIQKQGDQWLVKTQDKAQYLSPHVVIGTGVNRVPHVPKWRGQENFQGRIVHSRDYRNPEPFRGEKVLVIGMGNTGAEIALDLAEQGIETWISIRSPITIVPRDVNGRPVQVTAKTLDKLPFGLGDWLGTQIRKIIIGNLNKYGVPMSKVHPAVQLRDTGKTPVIDLGTVALLKKGKIKALPNVDHFQEKEIAFADGSHLPFDSVILATGYHAQIDDFLEDAEGMLNRHQIPKGPVGEGKYEGLYFIGFDNYKLGGILGTIYNDSEVIADKISAA
jgi:cation diffusion facilitator CzcD-associated flavoprotein CzcO